MKPLKIETLLSVIESEAPDIVFMDSEHHNFFVGLFSNLEWELIRQSPVPVWFVHNDLEPMDSILSAIDFVTDDGSASEDMARTALDYQVFDYSKKIASLNHAKLKIVHAIPRPGWIQPLMQTSPVALSGPLSVSANFSQDVNEIQREYERNIIDSHRNAIDAFATYFGQSGADVVKGVGQPSEVINEQAVKQQAGLIIMGATNLGRWERVISSPNAEPTLAKAPCDVLFINKNSQLPSLKADEVPLLTEVIANPSGHFDDLTQLETDHRYSPVEKRRILRSWIYDQKQLLIAGDEGMKTTAPLLPALESLIERIELETTRSGEHRKTTNASGQ